MNNINNVLRKILNYQIPYPHFQKEYGIEIFSIFHLK